tara:strand:- start:170 stop:631 length:462 start_codon:yes stop_codon:yes gene_type:complete
MVGVCKSKKPEKYGKAMFAYLQRKEVSCIPNYWTSNPRTERDLICIDSNFHVSEFEIKTSLTDLSMEHCKSRKLSKIISGDCMVNYFSYLVPLDVYKEALKRIPVEFGVYASSAQGDRIYRKRPPTKLHDRKASSELMCDILLQASIRYWNKK